MKISKRQSVFETNSSSVHTFSIKPYNSDIGEYLNGYDYINIVGQDFGWGIEFYDDWTDKISYLLTLASNLQIYDEVYDKLAEIFDEYNCKINFNINDGYVDHASEKSKLIDYIMEDVKYLTDYIFGNGIIIIDNDNSDYEERWMEEGLEVSENEYGGQELIEDKYTFSC